MNHKELMEHLKNTEEALERQMMKTNFELLSILMRIRKKNPSPENTAAIESTVALIKHSNIHKHEEREIALEDIDL